MLTVVEAEIARIAIPFRFGFRHSLAERSVGDGVLLTLRDGEGRHGYGECTPRAYVSGETSATAIDVLLRRVPRMLGRRFETFEALTEALVCEAVGLPREEHSAFSALELALLDLGGRAFGRSAGEPIGPIRAERIEYSGVVSATGKAKAERMCAKMKEFGVTRVKVKVGGELEEDLAVLGAVRETLGGTVGLRVDANGAWDAETALARLRAFEPFELEGCEQPCASSDLQGMAWLSARTQVPVIADESLVSIADARRLAEMRACRVFNVRISKCGGLLQSARIRDLGREAGIDTMLGAHVGETAILAAAGRQFAARTAGLRFAEGSYGKFLLRSDVSDAMDLGPGLSGAAIQGAGLGIEIDPERIKPFTFGRKKLKV